MRISILGAGAMGMLFGAYLSKENSVWLVDVNGERVDGINAAGVTVREADGRENVFNVRAVTDSSGLGEMDLIIVFVKSMFTQEALAANRTLLGSGTYLMTLQNGAGHELGLLRFADAEHIIIGTTQHNASVLLDGVTCHGGEGLTCLGLLGGDGGRIAGIAESFNRCGIRCVVGEQVRRQIWEKLFTNTAASSLTAVLKVPLGFILEDPYAHALMTELCREAVSVANAEGGWDFDEEEVCRSVEEVCRNARDGRTSILADILNGRRTEVDTISGSVVSAAHALGISAPYHEMLVSLIHAMEDIEGWRLSGSPAGK